MARVAKAALKAGAAVLAAALALAEPTITLKEASARKPPDFTPLHEGKSVVVSGQVSTEPIHVGEVFHLAIQEKGQGIVLEGGPSAFGELSPGDWVEARGRIANRAGLAVVAVSRVTIVSSGAPPVPVPLSPAEVQDLERLGQLVVTEGPVIELGSNFGGAYLRMGSHPNTLKVFLPSSPGARRTFAGFSVGETVRVTGVAYQYCPIPPHSDQFELLIGGVTDVTRLSGSWLPQLKTLWPVLAVLAAMGLFWWRREIASRTQREMLRTVYQLGEEILSSGSSQEIMNKIRLALPKVLRVTGARLYLYDRGTNSLAPVGEPSVTAVSIDSPSGLAQSSVVACFQNRSLLSIPDARRHPFPADGEKPAAPLPRSILFIPMQAQGEPIGVFQVENHRSARSFSHDEQAVAQHLANQIGLAVKLLQQRSFREQLSRSEKLAAVGRLISGVVNDLQTPLEAISSMANSALEQHAGPTGPSHELLVIASETRRASAIVSRLVSFAQPEQKPAEPVELRQLLRNLIHFREREWKACGIQLSNHIREKKPVYVLGSQAQLEQVFLNLFVHAEQDLEEAAEKKIMVRADVLAKRVFVEIAYSTGLQQTASPASARPDPNLHGEASALGLDVCRTMASSHGGELRITTSGQRTVLEVELPCLPAEQLAPAEAPAPEPVRSSRRWTALLLEQEEFVERRLVEALTTRGYRVVPVRSSEEGLDLVQRMRFDVVFCSTQLNGLNWVEFFDRVRGRVGAFALLAEAFSQDLSAHFRGEGRFVLNKPIEQSQFDRTLAAIEGRLTGSETQAPEVESY